MLAFTIHALDVLFLSFLIFLPVFCLLSVLIEHFDPEPSKPAEVVTQPSLNIEHTIAKESKNSMGIVDVFAGILGLVILLLVVAHHYLPPEEQPTHLSSSAANQEDKGDYKDVALRAPTAVSAVDDRLFGRTQEDALRVYRNEIRQIDESGAVFTDVELPENGMGQVIITVSSDWFYQPYEVRKEQVFKLWEGWVGALKPKSPDMASVVINNMMGQRVGGSGWCGGRCAEVEK